MLIDKVLSFYTDQDRVELAELDKQIELVLKKSAELHKERDLAREAGDEQRARELSENFSELWVNQYGELYKKQHDIVGDIERRYIESFDGDITALLADVREIVDATEKEEYLEYQKRLSQEVKEVIVKHIQLAKKNPTKENRARFKELQAMATRGYANCRLFILGRIRVQLNAFHRYNSEDGRDEAIAMVEARAEQFYKKPKGATPAREPAEHEYTLPIQDRSKITGGLLTYPTSPTLNLINEVLGVGDLDTLPARKRRYNRNIQLLVEEQGDKRRISYTKDKTQVTVEVADFRKLDTRNTKTKKILARILVRANEQAIHNGELTRDKVSFQLRELVGEGQYTNIETARQGFYRAADTLTSLKVSGKIDMERGKKRTIQQAEGYVLFTGYKVNNAICEIYLNERINWGLIVPYYTGLPDYYFALPDRAAELLEYIFVLARMDNNTRKIAEQGYFTISYRALQSRLNLPDETKSKNPGRDIKEAIEKAVSQIEEKYSEKLKENAHHILNRGQPDFALLLVEDSNAPIKDYLDKGYLKVSLKGDYAKRFIEISRKKADKIEAAEKRREKIADKARAINLAKHMERDEE